jgi:hypothetical protein
VSSARILAAAVVGGVVMFLWGAVAHMGLSLSDMAFQNLPGEQVILPAFKISIEERGVYGFPGMDKKDKSEEAKKAWEEKYRDGPRGFLIYDPTGGEAMSMSQLGTELASNVLAALLAAVLLAKASGSIALRAIYGVAIGLIGWLSIDVSYWNWYRFTSGFAGASLIEQTVGWFFTALAIALVLGRKKANPGAR